MLSFPESRPDGIDRRQETGRRVLEPQGLTRLETGDLPGRQADAGGPASRVNGLLQPRRGPAGGKIPGAKPCSASPAGRRTDVIALRQTRRSARLRGHEGDAPLPDEVPEGHGRRPRTEVDDSPRPVEHLGPDACHGAILA